MGVEMERMSPSALLDVWEQGVAQPAVHKALLLLHALLPDESPEALAARSIGQRNSLLLTLREWLFGAQFESVAMCPECGERLELFFETADIRAEAPREPEVTPAPEEALGLDVAGYAVQFRLPNSADLASVMGYEDPAAAQRVLLARCVLSVDHAGVPVDGDTPETLPAEVVDAIVDGMEQADPQANIVLALTCPACGHEWQAVLDILTYVWDELDAWARRALREVHYLASTYGWSEAEILNLRPWRRQIYMDLIGR